MPAVWATHLFQLETGSLRRMAVDVKSRAKRYEKLDFLGEGQVRLSGGARKVLGTERRAASHCGKFSRGSQRPGHAPRSRRRRLRRRPCCPFVLPASLSGPLRSVAWNGTWTSSPRCQPPRICSENPGFLASPDLKKVKRPAQTKKFSQT